MRNLVISAAMAMVIGCGSSSDLETPLRDAQVNLGATGQQLKDEQAKSLDLERQLRQAEMGLDETKKSNEQLREAFTVICSFAEVPTPRTRTTTFPVPVPTATVLIFPEAFARGYTERSKHVSLQPSNLWESVNYDLRDEAFLHAVRMTYSTAKHYGVPFDNGDYDLLLDWRDATLDVVREALKSPDRLWPAYTALKPVMLQAYSAAKTEDQQIMRIELATLYDLFNAPVPGELRLASHVDSEVWARAKTFREATDKRAECSEEIWKSEAIPAQNSFEAAAKGTAFDPEMVEETTFNGKRYSHASNEKLNILQWRLRRESEGGQPLVNAWARVFKDLLDSLPAQ